MVICYAAPCSRFGGQLIKASVGRENFLGVGMGLALMTKALEIAAKVIVEA